MPSLNDELTTITEKLKLTCTVPIVMVLSPSKSLTFAVGCLCYLAV